MKKEVKNIDKKIIDNIKALAIDMIDVAGSGHPGIVLGAAPTIYTLYARHMNINTNDEKWMNRDRFIMSAGHGSALLYSTLFMAGYNLSMDDLKNFRRMGYKTPGHPEYGVTPGVDITTGPLGQGFASAVGIAMAENMLSNKYNEQRKGAFNKSKQLFDYNTYVLCSDGDLMEGVSNEAASLAGNYKLGKLIVLYDSNNVSLDGNTNLSFTENVLKRFEAMGWHTQYVKDGENVDEIDKAITRAKKVGDKPSIIEIKTVIGRGSLLAGTNAVHGKPLTKDDIEQLKGKLDVRAIAFSTSNEASQEFRATISNRSGKKYSEWAETLKIYLEKAPDNVKFEIESIGKQIPTVNIDLPKLMWNFNDDMKESLRDTNGKVMGVIADNVFNFIGGNADLAASTKAYLPKYTVYNTSSYIGRNIFFGVREHAMGSILNGLAVSGFRVFGGTFLAFADYLKPAIRMSAIMNLPVTYVFTHDSVNIGPDGPTHQPIEQLAMLRSTPNLDVYRPADAKEIVGAWNSILKSKRPSALVISRNEVHLLKDSSMAEVNKGAYIVRKEVVRLSGIIIATGSEVTLALSVAEELYSNGIDLRVVSMPCMEKFLEQSVAYREGLIPVGYKTVVIEAASSFGWSRFVYNDKYLMTLDKFGASGTKDEVMEHFGFKVDQLKAKIEKLFR
ncbi:MAG: transketolase [Bacilli bacterium]|nr:transketolase [Bacilli bacterium]MDD3305281.1 transketolase [Bacilli bacterium]MDD4053571.1 transketolase [Bacilli bacterium]MDD4411462.1 transketolase [Bacilli bacterium]